MMRMTAGRSASWQSSATRSPAGPRGVGNLIGTTIAALIVADVLDARVIHFI